MLRSQSVRPVLLASVACASLLLGGCASVSKDDLAKVQAQAAQAQQTADQANQAAAAANQKADQALSVANQANQTANATNEKLDRMFKKSMMK